MCSHKSHIYAYVKALLEAFIDAQLFGAIFLCNTCHHSCLYERHYYCEKLDYGVKLLDLKMLFMCPPLSSRGSSELSKVMGPHSFSFGLF